ncbi:MAG: hypothetical protein HEP71_33490 [Roseivirga sp.]|nr:hypothetical protein [Roseivirga sp.]
MKNILLSSLVLSLFFASSLHAQNANGAIDAPGDIAIVAYHNDDGASDQDDGFSFVLLDNAPPGSSILFTDDEWNGSVFDTGTGEGELIWINNTSNTLSAGTVISITSADQDTPTITGGGTLGIVLNSTDDGFGTSNSDHLFAVTGRSQSDPGVFLAYFGRDTDISLSGTGLTDGTTALATNASPSEGYYSGTTTFNGTIGAAASFINDISNWTVGEYTFPTAVTGDLAGSAFPAFDVSDIFDLETANDADTITQTVNSVMATFSNGSPDLFTASNFYPRVVNNGLFQNSATSSLDISFSTAINLISLAVVDGFVGSFTVVLTPSGGSNSAVEVDITGSIASIAVLNWTDVSSLSITKKGGGNMQLVVDNLIFSVPSSNTAPTASAFTASDGPFEDLVYTFATSDFSYSDSDSDPLDHLLIESVPASGTLYLDADNGDDYDAGEEVGINYQISKANLDAGNLQYIQNGSTNTSFQFEVNDGTDDSAGNYAATLNVVAKPTVTLSQTNSTLSESAIGTTGTVTATLSNSYGATVTVNLSTSGATVTSDFTISSTSIVISSGDTEGDATITIVDDSDLEDTETLTVEISSVTNGTESGSQSKDFTITNNDFALSLKVFLEGPLSGSSMSTAINSSLPTNPGTVYSGILNETSSGVPSSAVDWVEVELRTGTGSGAKVGTNRAGVLKSDGTIVDKDGNDFTMSQTDGTGYYIVIHHRNHLSVMSASAVNPTAGVYTHDFTTSQAGNYNNGSDGAIQVGSVFAMIAGDTDDDGDVDGTDLTTWRAQNGVMFSYSSNGKTDLNLDGVINAVDRNAYQKKNDSKSTQVPGS